MFEYTKEGVTLLLDVLKKKTLFFNQIYKEVLNSEKAFTINNLLMTIGAQTSQLAKAWVEEDTDVGFLLSLRKIGIINPKLATKVLNEVRELHNELFLGDDYRITYKENPKRYQKLFEQSSYLSLGYSNASVFNLLLDSAKTDTGIGSLVYGGRAINERPEQFLILNGAEIDIVSAYTTALLKQEYPIGSPTIVTNTHNQIPITLREFLEKNEYELIPGLYTIHVSGEFSFNQDLILSKNVSSEDISRIASNFSQKKTLNSVGFESNKTDNDQSHLPGDVILARCELQYAVITSELLELIKEIASSYELKEFMELKVNVAVFYRKSDRVNSREEWIERVSQDKGTFYYSTDNQNPIDNRSRCWYSVPLEELIQPLLDQRKTYKALYKQETDLQQKAFYWGMQISLKQEINSIFGGLACPYFQINNCILANNITASIRAAIWLMSKALGHHISVTDGGSYCINNVLFLKEGGKLPGFDRFSDLKTLEHHKTIKMGPLGGQKWDDVYEKPNSIKEFNALNVDKIALNHVRDYWSLYNIPFTYELEHRVYPQKIVYLNKANHGLLLQDEQGQYTRMEYKIRSEQKDIKISPTRQIIDKIFRGDKNPIINKDDFSTPEIITLGPNEYRQAHTKADIDKGLIQFIPGRKITRIREYKPNNTQVNFDTIEQFDTVKKSREKNSNFFREILSTLGFKHMIEQMNTKLYNPKNNKNKKKQEEINK